MIGERRQRALRAIGTRNGRHRHLDALKAAQKSPALNAWLPTLHRPCPCPDCHPGQAQRRAGAYSQGRLLRHAFGTANRTETSRKEITALGASGSLFMEIGGLCRRDAGRWVPGAWRPRDAARAAREGAPAVPGSRAVAGQIRPALPMASSMAFLVSAVKGVSGRRTSSRQRPSRDRAYLTQAAGGSRNTALCSGSNLS